MATENRGTLIMIKMAKEIREQGHDQDEQRKERRDDQDQDDQRAPGYDDQDQDDQREQEYNYNDHEQDDQREQKHDSERSEQGSFSAGNAAKKSNHVVEEEGRKRYSNIFLGEIQGFVLIKVDISWRGTGHHTVQNTLHLFYLGTYLVIIVYDTVATVPES